MKTKSHPCPNSSRRDASTIVPDSRRQWTVGCAQVATNLSSIVRYLLPPAPLLQRFVTPILCLAQSRPADQRLETPTVGGDAKLKARLQNSCGFNQEKRDSNTTRDTASLAHMTVCLARQKQNSRDSPASPLFATYGVLRTTIRPFPGSWATDLHKVHKVQHPSVWRPLANVPVLVILLHAVRTPMNISSPSYQSGRFTTRWRYTGRFDDCGSRPTYVPGSRDLRVRQPFLNPIAQGEAAV